MSESVRAKLLAVLSCGQAAGVSDTNTGVSNINTGVSNIECSVSNTKYSVSNTEYGVSNTEYGASYIEQVSESVRGKLLAVLSGRFCEPLNY